jgi:hypothetical protein
MDQAPQQATPIRRKEQAGPGGPSGARGADGSSQGPNERLVSNVDPSSQFVRVPGTVGEQLHPNLPSPVSQGFSAPSLMKEYFVNVDYMNLVIVFMLLLLVCSNYFTNMIKKIPNTFDENGIKFVTTMVVAILGTLLYFSTRLFFKRFSV